MGIKGGASVLSGRATVELSVHGWELEIGASEKILSAGAEATVGLFPNDVGGTELRANCGASTGVCGGGFHFRLSTPG